MLLLLTICTLLLHPSKHTKILTSSLCKWCSGSTQRSVCLCVYVWDCIEFIHQYTCLFILCKFCSHHGRSFLFLGKFLENSDYIYLAGVMLGPLVLFRKASISFPYTVVPLHLVDQDRKSIILEIKLNSKIFCEIEVNDANEYFFFLFWNDGLISALWHVEILGSCFVT